MSGPTPRVRQLVYDRDAQCCAWCGRTIAGTYGSLQHRRSRGAGGSKREDTNLPANLVLVDGSGTTGCHGRIEAAPELARHYGYRISQQDDPAEVPFWTARYGWILADNFGGFIYVDDPRPDETAALQRISDAIIGATS